ncbi:MAG: PDDEXK nuclease domain-containing protein [Blastocatellia bacterium]
MKKKTALAQAKRTAPSFSDNSPAARRLYQRVREILEQSRLRVARSVNTEMVRAYWLIGQAIVEQEQKGKSRADYGERLIESLSERLTADFGRGFQSRTLWWMRDFYLKFPILNALRSELSWTHYRLLLKVENPQAREFYETESAAGNWSTRQLERQINSFFYERAGLSKNKRKMLSEGRTKGEQYEAGDFVRDPYVLEFLGLRASPELTESQIETALLDHIQEFLLELGKGFSFVGRQVRITIDGDHFYIDLVLYNRLMRCFVLIDLKTGKLVHQDIGQMQLYTNWYSREMREEWENPAVGLLLCADKNDAVVRYTLPEDNRQVFASRYKLYLPTEEEIVTELRREQDALALRVKTDAARDAG